MKNKKTHLLLIFISIMLLCCLSFLEIFGFITKQIDVTLGNIVGNIFLCIWIINYPIAFYTCWRLILLEEKKGTTLFELIYATRGGICGGVFFIPLLLAPFFLHDYIIFFKQDLKNI